MVTKGCTVRTSFRAYVCGVVLLDKSFAPISRSWGRLRLWLGFLFFVFCTEYAKSCKKIFYRGNGYAAVIRFSLWGVGYKTVEVKFSSVFLYVFLISKCRCNVGR